MGGYHHVLGKTTELLQTAEHRAWSGRTQTPTPGNSGYRMNVGLQGDNRSSSRRWANAGNEGFTAEAEEVRRRGGDAEMGDVRGACAFFRKSL